jgi:threonylcarbamoyladenosine tRNA methylthiotransferase MtaB
MVRKVEPQSEKDPMNPTFRIEFLGCKTNQSDALSFAGMLQRAGWREALNSEAPSLIVIQTCTVTMSADAQGRQMIRKLKRHNPDSKLMLTGCYAERSERELAQMPEVDYVIGNLNPRKFEILSGIIQEEIISPYPDFVMPAESARTRQYIKIQDGCDARCSYCIIPFVRGRSRSLSPEEVIRRVEYYRDLGYKEMIFTGISMGGYGKDLTPRISLSELMLRVEALPGDFRIRLSSLEPEEIDDRFINVFTSSSRFQPHLHLPLQSASNTVLKKMRRQYLFQRYESIVNRIFAQRSGLNLGSDILVGFPEEGRDAFQETKRYLKQGPFAYCHIFPYSPRPGTLASGYKQAACNSEIAERAAELRAIASEKNLAYRKQFTGRRLRALVLHSKEEALTDNYIKVQISNRVPMEGIVSVQIDSVSRDHTIGTILN